MKNQKKHLTGFIAFLTLLFCLPLISSAEQATAAGDLTPPILAGVPRLDEFATNLRPVFVWNNSEGGAAPRTYVMQLDTDPSFSSPAMIEIADIPESPYVSVARPKIDLTDGTQWFWRVRAIDAGGQQSDWGTEIAGYTARFYLDTAWNDKMTYVRRPAAEIVASHGFGIDKIQDYDEGGYSHWEGFPNQSQYWVRFDMGRPQEISRIWLLCGMAGWKPREANLWEWLGTSWNIDGRLKEFVWQFSNDGRQWTDIAATRRQNANSFRHVFQLDDHPVTARYFRLLIDGWFGRAPKIHEVTLYAAAQPEVPEVPDGNYVLVLDNSRAFYPEAGKAKTNFGKTILGQGGHIAPEGGLKVLELPAYAFSMEVLEKMEPKPVAIFLTGFGRWDSMIPAFEFNGEFELIRTTQIPTLGACGGHQLMAQAYGFTFARDTGRSYWTNEIKDILDADVPPIHIQKSDPIFAGMVEPFYGPQFHSWTIQVINPGWHVLATSKDKKGFICNEMIRADDRPVYGTQFHAEIAKPFSASKLVLVNFIRMAVDKAKAEGRWIE